MARVHDPRGRAGWRNTTVTLERDGRRGRWTWLLMLAILTVAAPVAFYVVQQARYFQLRSEIEQLRRSQRHLVEAEQHYRVDRARLVAPPEVEVNARRLGLAPPTPRDVYVVGVAPEVGSWVARAPAEE